MGSSTPSRRLLTLVIAAALAALAGWCFLHGQPAGLPVDDAYIHLVYAQNLAQGLGWCFNPGEPSLGTSSPLWVFLIRCLLPFFAPVMAVSVLAFAGLVLSTILMADIALKTLPEEGWSTRWDRSLLALFAAALFAFSGNLLWIAFCGMETMVFLFLGLLAVRSAASGRPNALTALSLALLLLCRIEGWVLYLILPGWLGRDWFRKTRRAKTRAGFLTSNEPGCLTPAPCRGAIHCARPPGRDESRPYDWGYETSSSRHSILWFLIPPAAWLAWTIFTWFRFHEILPSTMQGKLASNLFNSGLNFRGPILFLWRHLVYFAQWPPELLLLLAVAALGLALRRFRPRFATLPENASQGPAPLLALVALWAIANFLLHALFFRSTAAITPYHYLRYQVPIFPALCLASTWTLFLLWENKFWKNLLRSLIISGLLLFILFSVESWRKIFSDNVHHLGQSHQAAALWAKTHLPKDARIAGFDIGSLKFFSGRYVIDLGGLTDPAVWPYLHDRRVGPYLVKERATYYFALDRPPEEGITGVRRDDGKLYRLQELARFDAPDYPTPVLLHSRGVIVYKLELIP